MAEDKERAEKGAIPFIPNHISTEAALWLVIAGAALYMAGVWPRGLGPPANPQVTPEHTRPEWYFLWLYSFMKYVPNKLIGVLLPGIAVAFLYLVPWLERNPHRHPALRPVAVGTMTAMVVAIVFLTWLGYQ